MADNSENPIPEQRTSAAQPGFLSSILAPGSSLHPSFLLVLDIAFSLLLCVFLALLILTRGNVHVLILIGIETCLWASVKWFVYELKKTDTETSEDSKTKQE
ncbi:hypothetical protein NM688_g791 [Phlebia brevispora]|uniref:Uncharacterized protein n=1 Tax=Phlebia brevispora TaxID=194682 RepID=A0ACC1TD39_9APHY|nr:hypothetical protein NM688_g791 [Phlebia brevispora]